MKNELKNKVNDLLDKLINDLDKGLIDEIRVLEELNSLVFYNDYYRPFIYELFFSRAIELGKIPEKKSLVLGLFKSFDIEGILITEDYSTEGVRTKVLSKLNLTESLKLYKYFLLCNIEESYLNFEDGEKNSFLIEARKVNPSINKIFDSISLEMKN